LDSARSATKLLAKQHADLTQRLSIADSRGQRRLGPKMNLSGRRYMEAGLMLGKSASDWLRFLLI